MFSLALSVCCDTTSRSQGEKAHWHYQTKPRRKSTLTLPAEAQVKKQIDSTSRSQGEKANWHYQPKPRRQSALFTIITTTTSMTMTDWLTWELWLAWWASPPTYLWLARTFSVLGCANLCPSGLWYTGDRVGHCATVTLTLNLSSIHDMAGDGSLLPACRLRQPM